MRARLGFSDRARKDWGRLDTPTRTRVMRALEGLASEEPPANVDVRPLVGLAPWRRMRIGEHRVIFRPLTRAELAPFPQDRGFFIERLIPRAELERATKGLR